MRIIDSSNLTVNESVLTGESVAVVKNTNIISSDTILAERKNKIYEKLEK